MKKRDKEVTHFKLFRSLFGNFPEGEVWLDESPDFLVLESGRTLGIEHCEIFKSGGQKGSPDQALESNANEITRIARQHAELRGLPPMHVSLTFSLRKTLKAADRVNYGREISRIVAASVPPLPGNTEITSYSIGIELPEWLDRIGISRHEVVEHHHWHTVNAGWVLQDCVELLQSAIDKKSGKHSSYKEKCSVCWLLIVADGSNPSSAIRPNQESFENIYHSPFDETYFLHCITQKLVRLRTR